MKLTEQLALKGLNRQDRYFLWALVLFNFLAVLYQISVTKELSASVFAFRSRLHIVFGFATIFYGFGMWAAHRRWQGRIEGGGLSFLAALAGLLTAASLPAVLKLRFEAGPVPRPEPLAAYLPLAGTVLLIAAALTVFGAIYAALLAYFSANRRGHVGAVVAYSQAGLIAAFFAHAALSVHIGVNGTMVLVSAAALFLAARAGAYGLKLPLALTALLLAALRYFPADAAIEKLRGSGRTLHRRTAYIGQMLTNGDLRNFVPLFDGWSAYSKINLYRIEGTKKVVGAYNYFPTWLYDDAPDPYRQRAYGFIRERDRVLCLAIGGGWPALSLGKAKPENVTGVEVDPVVVDFFLENPQYNGGLFHRINMVKAEGRSALDEAQGKFGAILVDLPGSPATIKENPTEFEDYLFTAEALEKYLELLEPDGVLAYYVLRHQVGGACATLKARGAYFRALLFSDRPDTPEGNSYLVLVSPDRARTDAIAKDVLSEPVVIGGAKKPVADVTARFMEADLPALTDDRPSPLDAIKKDPRMFAALLKAAGWISAFILLLSLAVVSGVRGTSRDRCALLYFLLIGAGYILFQFHVYARFRSCFGDLITTVIYTTAVFSLAGAAGSALAPHLLPLKRRAAALAAAALCVVYAYFAFAWVPFEESSLALKLARTVLIIAPFGLFGGLFFPAGLLSVKGAHLGWALLLDAFGAVLGFMIFYLMYWNTGTASTFRPLAACYLLATVLGVYLAARPPAEMEKETTDVKI